jgi:hypothetical protein
MSLSAQTLPMPAQIPSEPLPRAAFGEMLRANMRADFTFYRRSRLLLAFAIVFLLISGLFMLPTFFSDSRVEHFNTLRQIFDTLAFNVEILSGGLGLFIVSSHLRNRSLKMVFTKPCPPGLWLASAFLSAAFVAFLLTAGVLLSTIALSLCWHVPVRAGLLFMSLHSFVISLIVIGYTLLLGTLVHPALAIAVILIFNEASFFSAQEWAQAMIRSANGHAHLGIRVLEKFFYVIYLAAPTYEPFKQKFQTVDYSYRASAGEWKYLLYSAGYVLVSWAFCYFVALFALRKRRHI